MLTTFLETYMKLLRNSKDVKGLQELINKCADKENALDGHHVLSSLVCCDFRNYVDSSSRSCTRPVVLYVPNRVGFPPIRLGLTPTLSLSSERTLTQVTLSVTRHANLTTRRQRKLLSCVDKKEGRQTFKIMATGHHTGWDSHTKTCEV